MSQGIRKYYKFHYREQLDFRYRLYLLNNERNLSKRVNLAQNLMYHAFECGMGIYASPELEKPFLDLAETLPIFKDIQYTSNSFLHVMTQSYTTGGHTRVVERWVDSSPIEQKHSIVLLDQGEEPIPSKLGNVVHEHKGELYVFDGNSLEDRAVKLRELAMQYEYIILHIHMYDPTALVAFGSEEFTRPVVLFNHADHSYWCGASIVDMLADLRVNNFAKEFRGINNVHPIRIPFDINESIQNFSVSKLDSRRKLGLPLDKKIILTVGGAHKYTPFAGFEFCDVISKTISSMDNVVCYGVGPSKETGNWGNSGEKFIAVGEINYGEEYFHYLNACDVYVNSFPIGGGTAMLDAVQFHKPVVSYSLFDTNLGNILNGVDTTYDLNQFGDRLRNLLLSEDVTDSLAKSQYDGVIECHGIEQWRKNIYVMLSKTPLKHSIHDISNVRYKINDLAIMISLWNKSLSNKSLSIYDTYHVFLILYRYIKDFSHTLIKKIKKY